MTSVKYNVVCCHIFDYCHFNVLMAICFSEEKVAKEEKERKRRIEGPNSITRCARRPARRAPESMQPMYDII